MGSQVREEHRDTRGYRGRPERHGEANMRQWTVSLMVVGSVLGMEEVVKDEDRACPTGFFYAGEVPENTQLARGENWEKGPTSPVYSCYRRLESSGTGIDWVNATRLCSKEQGHLLSVNNFQETAVLTGELFLNNLVGETDNLKNVTLPASVITSGISLEKDKWIWFGAGKSESSEVSSDITADLTTSGESTYCLTVTFLNSSPVTLSYTAVPCVNRFTEAICEVRVYEQVWYVFFTTNWLQILFLLTLIMLLISACITFQIWVSRPSRQARASSLTSNPPAYSPRDQEPRSAKARLEAAADRYTEKGKEIMAKVVFYRKPEDKQRIVTEA